MDILTSLTQIWLCFQMCCCTLTPWSCIKIDNWIETCYFGQCLPFCVQYAWYIDGQWMDCVDVLWVYRLKLALDHSRHNLRFLVLGSDSPNSIFPFSFLLMCTTTFIWQAQHQQHKRFVHNKSHSHRNQYDVLSLIKRLFGKAATSQPKSRSMSGFKWNWGKRQMWIKTGMGNKESNISDVFKCIMWHSGMLY